MEPRMPPKIDQNPSPSPPEAQDGSKVAAGRLPELQNEPPGLQKEATDKFTIYTL